MAKSKVRKNAIPRPYIPGAVQAPMPDTLLPQLATLTDAIPRLGEWLYEIKLDGYRLMTRFKEGKPALITRRGHDWSARMPGLVKELAGLGIESAWLEGEIVVLSDDGVPDFNALQNAFEHRASAGIVYFLFDVPFFEGYDLRRATLGDRRSFLEALLEGKITDHIRVSSTFNADPKSILQSACKMGLEGVIAKRVSAPYVSRRTDDWLKLKCKRRQEFVIAGYLNRTGTTGRSAASYLASMSQANSYLLGAWGQDLIQRKRRRSKRSSRSLSRTNRPLQTALRSLGDGRSVPRSGAMGQSESRG